MTDDLSTEDPRFTAAIDMVGRTGARTFQIRYQDDEEPTIWIAIAQYGVDEKDHPIAEGGRLVYKIGASLHPVMAVIKLMEEAMDGGFCVHCTRPTGVTLDIDAMPMNDMICWYQYDPELQTFRRGCE